MSLFYILMLGFVVSLDSIAAGIAYGTKNIHMPANSLLIIGVVTSVCSAIAMVCASFLDDAMATHIVTKVGALLLSLLGICNILREVLSKNFTDSTLSSRKLTFNIGRIIINIIVQPENADIDHSFSISGSEAIVLGLALGIDNAVATFGGCLLGSVPLYTPIIMGAIQMGCISTGLLLSSRLTSSRLKKNTPYLAGIILILLGLLRLL